jgi:hypothetical protein
VPLKKFSILLALGLALLAADKKGEIEILEASAHRGESTISIEGRLRNISEKPLRRLTLLIDFMAPGRQVVTTQRARIDEEILPVGDESVFRLELKAPPRAVEFQFNAVDDRGRDQRVANPGPFPIE